MNKLPLWMLTTNRRTHARALHAPCSLLNRDRRNIPVNKTYPLLMKASAQSTLVATLVGTAVGSAMWHYGLGSQVWPAHPDLCALFVTLFATVLSQRIWSPEHFRRRTS
jgi:hypothetical protein